MGVPTLSVRRVFDFCVDEGLSNEDWPDAPAAAVLTRMLEEVEAQGGDISAEQEVEAAVFQKAFIPKNLSELDEKSMIKDSAAGVANTYYGTVTGMSTLAMLESQRKGG